MRNEGLKMDDLKEGYDEINEAILSVAVSFWKSKQKMKAEFADKDIEGEKDRFGKYLTETQVDKWADRLKEADPEKAENNIWNIRDWIEKRRFCSSSEGMLHNYLQLEKEGPESPTFDPAKTSELNQLLILLLSECLKRPYRRPGTNPDKV